MNAPTRIGDVHPYVWWWRCHSCRLASIPLDSGPECLELAGVHDRLHHGGAKTARLRAVRAVPSARELP